MTATIDILNDFKNYLQLQKSYSLKTVEAYIRDVIKLLDFCKINKIELDQDNIKNTISQIDRVKLNEWLINLRNSNLSHRSIARIISANKTFVNYLNKNYNITSPISNLKSPKFQIKLHKSFEKDVIQNVISEVEKIHNNNIFLIDRDKLILEFMFTTGMRISEVLSLKYSHIIQIKNNNYIKIVGKGSKERVIPVTKKIKEMIATYKIHLDQIIDCKIAKIENIQIFIQPKSKKTTSARSIQILIEKIRYNLNLPNFLTPHSLRHSCAVNLLKKNANIRQIQDLLGHSSLSTTQGYLKISKQHLSEKLKKVKWD